MKKLYVIILAVLMIVSSLVLTGCNESTTTVMTADQLIKTSVTKTVSMYNVDKDTWEPTDKVDREITYKGVIRIGNTNPTSGDYAASGGEYNEGLISYINALNFGGGLGGDYENGVQGYYIEFIHYDDNYADDRGIRYTKKLVEEDGVFAIVGQFSENTVDATISYISNKGVVFVGAASGNNNLASATNIYPTRPLSTAEGEYTVQKIKDLYPDANKIGIIFVDDGEGADYKDAVINNSEWECIVVNAKNGKFDANEIMDCDVIVVGAGKKYTERIVTTLIKEKVGKPVFTSSNVFENVFANEYNKLDEADKFPIYANNWLSLAHLEEALTCGMDILQTYGVTDNVFSPYAIEGWVAADVFMTGLERMLQANENLADNLTAEKYAQAMEAEPIRVMTGVTYTNGNFIDTYLDFANGNRAGATMSALKRLNAENAEFEEMISEY